MCLGEDCHNEAGTLQCPTCLKLGLKDSFFCSQDCFKRNWVGLQTPTASSCCTEACSSALTKATRPGHPQDDAQATEQYAFRRIPPEGRV
jgi:hypothetical protein